MLLKTLAEKLTTEINLYTSDFRIEITDDKQKYDEWIALDNLPYIPCILTVTSSFRNENQYSENFIYNLSFKVDIDLRDDFIDVYNAFKEAQANETISGSYIVKTTQSIRAINEDVVNGKDYMTFNAELNWTYLSVISGRDVSISIDDIQIPFITYQPTHDIAYVSNQSNNSSYRMTNDSIVLIVPIYLSNAKIAELYEDINSDTYNKTYELTVETDSVSYTKTLALKKGFMTITKDATVVGMQLTFETHYPRVTIKFDDVELPIISYMQKTNVIQSPDNRDGEDIVYSTETEKTRSWIVKIVNNGSDKYNEIKSNTKSDNLGYTYTLTDYDGNDYIVGVSEMSDTFTDTGDMAIELSLVEVRS